MANFNYGITTTNQNTPSRNEMNRNYNTEDYNKFEKKHADDYRTPKWLITFIKSKYNITTDIACDSTNAITPDSPLYDRGFDALEESWSQFKGAKYCFPPFSKPNFSYFLAKAHNEWMKGETTAFLAPLKTISVSYFQNIKCPVIDIIYPRVNFIFNGKEVSYPDSVCVLHYDASIPTFTTPKVNFVDVGLYNRERH